MHKKKWGIASIVIIFIAIICQVFPQNQKDKDLSKKDFNKMKSYSEESQVDQNQYHLEYDKEHPVLRFASEIVENHVVEGIAMIPVYSCILDQDAHGKYLAEVGAVGIDEENNTSIYTYYIILDNKESLSVAPNGIEVFKDQLDQVKKDLIVSMMKVLNNWGDSM
jgi:hypothetical protein